MKARNILYGFVGLIVFLMVLGATSPHRDANGMTMDERNASVAPDTATDIAWWQWTAESVVSIDHAQKDVLAIADAGGSNYDVYQALGKVIDQINAVEDVNRQYAVSSKYRSAKGDYESYLHGTKVGCEELQKVFDAKSLEERSNAEKKNASWFAYAGDKLTSLIGMKEGR
jgi:hypothetical protein